MTRRFFATAAFCVWAVSTAAAAAPNLLTNGDFSKADGGKPAGWTIRGKQTVSVDSQNAPQGATQSLKVEIVADGGKNLGEILQVVRVKPDTRYRLRGQIKASEPGLGLLQIKRIKDGKEIGRLATGWNKDGWSAAETTFDSADADSVQVICRYRQRAEDVGRTAHFAALSLEEQGELLYEGPETPPSAVPTFHSVGLYWKAPGGGPARPCTVRYRPAGQDQWREAMDLWFDPYDHGALEQHSLEYRGSIVNLAPGTRYEVELSIAKAGLKRTLSFETWSETFKIARRVDLPARQPDGDYVIKDGGDAQNGYVLYCPPDGAKSDWDAAGKCRSNLRIEASYVIVRGLTLRGAQVHGIELGDVQNVVLEDCDISGWGRVRESDGYGENLDSAVYSASKALETIVIQRCRLHHPRSDSNSWKEKRVGGTFHPGGAQGVSFRGGRGRYVIRYNRIDSDIDHMFNDGMGEFKNFSYAGFPNRDSDIYGNYVSHCWDDGLEIEGANMNVRVWGNYITMTYGAIGAASTSLGPSYYFRNVYAVSRKAQTTDENSFRGHFLIKLGSEPKSAEFSRGRKYFFHNTTLQPPTVGGPDPASGAQSGLVLTSATKRELNIVSRNNILHLRRQSDLAIRDPQLSKANDFDYDLYTGRVQAAEGAEAHGIVAIPVYDRAPDGRLWLRPGTPGHDAAQRIPNFNDDFVGAGPDMGAVETGTAEPKPALWPEFPQQAPTSQPATQPASANATQETKTGN